MSKNGGFFLGALFGASVAGIAALLYTPKSGKEMRKDIAQEVDRLLDTASEYTDYAVERGVEFVDAAYETKEDIKVNLKESADTFKAQIDDIRVEATQEWERVKEDIKKSKDDLAQEATHLKETAKDKAENVGAVTGAFVDEVSSSAADYKEAIEEEFKD